MKSLSRLWNAIGTLAGSLEALAALVNTTNARLQQSLAVEVIEPEQLTGPEETGPRRKVRAAS